MCPEPDCGEVILLSDFNDHLDFHTAESLSFDETTGKYHSHHSSARMHRPATTRHSYAASSKSTVSEHSLPDAARKSGGHGHKGKRRSHRERSNTNSSEKSTISRSILNFNPFTTPDKTIKPPSKSARLGVSLSRHAKLSQTLMIVRNLSSALTHGKIVCLSGCMSSLMLVQA